MSAFTATITFREDDDGMGAFFVFKILRRWFGEVKIEKTHDEKSDIFICKVESEDIGCLNKFIEEVYLTDLIPKWTIDIERHYDDIG